LANGHVTVSGSVDDVRPFLSSATVSVVPLRVAGGSRLKILESMAAGLPVVSTSIGAEGLELQAGRQLLIADDEDSFASQCVRLLDRSSLREQLVHEGRLRVKEKYEWRCIAPLVESAWQRTERNFIDNRKLGG
jgi:glycosyltransferase involved in cell wall biosynthesis